ncbi:hypothetical protein HETIRDRAFT_101986 [Heterobasidion irregulare TC 32-1]|uniref:Uncharacterized protein n=1 Tax=Heterobasidion irregulare (strain TC 32-1) TaxID=747525 RepID=W4K514_HETIT|nr:uncharacterized protein HETIRDRAFT_101986 [Heterobasidion irregulare TC 32-1]ETW80908.1 hypothetical protein HETIRDRAFT_101986 [Heterobasidion irregulare TC 32-1]
MSTSNSSDARAHPTPLADSAHDFVLDRIRENRFDVELTLEVGIYITRMGDVEKGSRWVDKGKFVQSKTRHRILRRDRIADIAFRPDAELNKHTDHADNTVRVFVGSACQGDNDNLVKVVWFFNSPDRVDRYRVVGYYPLEGYGQHQIDDLATLGSSEFRRRLEGIYSRQREFTGPGRRAILTPPEL